MIQLKRVYEPPQPSDACRILVDRVWPRGVSKEQARIALWLKEVGPSTGLRKWFGHDPERWAEFQKRYRQELGNKSDLLARIRELEKEHGRVTLVFSAHDAERNQAVALRDFLAESGAHTSERGQANKKAHRTRAGKKAGRRRARKKVRG